MQLGENIELAIPPRAAYIPFGAMVLGTLIGGVRGGRMAGMRFLAENAHRPPKTKRGWYLYWKTRNYKVALASLQEGGRWSMRLGFIALSWVVCEEGMYRAGLGDVRELGAAVGTTGVFAGVWRLGLRDAGRASVLSLVIGSSMMGLRLLQERMMRKEGEEARDGVADGVESRT
ncbi:hypothetical protein PENSPDRAFT_587764 [Peniophora sp. CONT]|nr:hypothetical protein PENSPDRAFT_587764 [Peniophora sp. CONT]